MPVYGVRKASLTSIVRGSNNAIQVTNVYRLSKIGSVPPVSSSDLAAVPVLPLAIAAENLHVYAMRRRKYYCGIAHPRTLSSLYLLSTLNVTHVIKSSRPSPAFMSWGQRSRTINMRVAGVGLGTRLHVQ